MNFAKWTFRLAGIYGLIIMTPLLFLEETLGRQYPPPVNHPEYYYGFICAVIAWQIAFLIVSRDPLRHRPLMLAAMVEKFPYAISVALLVAQGRTAPAMLGAALIDGMLGVLFVIAYLKTRSAAATATLQGAAARA